MQEFGLTGLKTPADYISERRHIWPNLYSFDWWTRQHRTQLVAAEAFVVINRRKLINPETCDQVALEAGIARVRISHDLG
jgi:hypothetical protein